ATAVATASVVTPASAYSSLSLQCGYNETQYDAIYLHCGNPNVSVEIEVSYPSRPNYKFCTSYITPYRYYLGSASAVNHAWFNGVICGVK
ncbi:DUF6355 family natural product biosynthesis protein, partial [Allokutzneria sp. NRRL B-24872]|uniref:DUF6355 family natural product biosynthesis protein n=1 Tax=Allokutzneria sp. NRRL B-24872 TaxID=1137961 RepID=UPI000A3BD17B